MSPHSDVPDPPGHLLDLIERLDKHGFSEVEASCDARSFGNVVRLFLRPPVRVRIIRDRGDWSAEFTADGWPTHDHFGDEWVFLPPAN